MTSEILKSGMYFSKESLKLTGHTGNFICCRPWASEACSSPPLELNLAYLYGTEHLVFMTSVFHCFPWLGSFF